MVGRVFWEEPVARALQGESVSDHLGTLERKGFIRALSTSSLQDQPEFSFRHALVRDVAYASLPKTRRPRAHAEVAAWIEELLGARLEEFAELVADHYVYAAAGEDVDLAWPDPAERELVRQRAFESLLQAGTAARRRFVLSRSVELHQQALELARIDAERLRAREELGDDHESAFHGDEARAAYLEALALARSQPSLRPDRARLCWKLGYMLADRPGAFRTNPEPQAVDELVSEGLAVAETAVDRANLLIASGVSARLWRGSEPFGHGSQPDPVPIDERIERVKQGLAIAREDPAVGCRLVRDGPVLGAAVLVQGGSFAAAAELMAMVPDPLEDIPTASAWQSLLALAMGDPVTARRISDGKALERRTYGPQHALALVQTLIDLTEWDALSAFLTTARRQADGNALLDPWCDVGEGLIRLARGDRAGARSNLERAVAGFARLQAPFDAARGKIRLAEALEPAAARRALESARATFVELGATIRAEQADKRLSALT